MPGLLENKLALILGIANKWSLAYAIAQAYSREGARLVLTYLGEHQREAVESMAKELNVERIAPCDVTKEQELSGLSDTLRSIGRPLDSVVHSLAFANREDLNRGFIETPREGFLLAQEVSAYSLVAVARAAARAMTAGGSITTLTYLGSTRVVPNYNVMGVAKAALEASVRYLASELGPSGIRVNAICPVMGATGLIEQFLGAPDTPESRARIIATIPLGRMSTPEDVANAALYLASDAARFITGIELPVDGGRTI